MITTYDLKGEWAFTLDEYKKGIKNEFFKQDLEDTIYLPTTTAQAKKGKMDLKRETYYLSEEYPYVGYAWYKKVIDIEESFIGKPMKLFLERTRLTKLWINGIYVGDYDSLCTPHIYDVTPFITSTKVEITILVNNADYVTKGGHMTSPDTQTNWNGITGTLELRVYDAVYIEDIKAYPNIYDRSVLLKIAVVNTTSVPRTIVVSVEGETEVLKKKDYMFEAKVQTSIIEVNYLLGDQAELWSEYTPILHKLNVCINHSDEVSHVSFGLRVFQTNAHYFLINDMPTFLRGKHDGLIFPMTGAAPTTVEEWMKVLSISKEHGINHYRFHTCCPPDAAFTAADLLGIYMEPELPFWGTLTARTDENHNEVEQQYLITEGKRILETFGNHPSFTMMSLGNELWGSKERMAEIIREYKEIDTRHLYTQGSNNFQFNPVILDEDDFYVGVRFSRERLIRASYAMCDAPLGFMQSEAPRTNRNYDEHIIPTLEHTSEALQVGEIDIQYGTGTKKVKVEETYEEMIPNKPVVSHEIGQYATFPNFKEIEKYTGVLKARNFEVFKERLEEKGLLDLADQYFYASGKLAVACYKEELEAALGSAFLAGYQLLDLQDFSGQGTALVGILDAFMASKGLISSKEWRHFCSDAVILAQFNKYNYIANESFTADVSLSYYKYEKLVDKIIMWEIYNGDEVIDEGKIPIPHGVFQLHKLGKISINMPSVKSATKLKLALSIPDTDIENGYDLWVYPIQENVAIEANVIVKQNKQLFIVNAFNEAKLLLERGERVLFLPCEVKEKIQGFYCTDFWNYPMFRSISESVNKPIPIGTMGLLIDKDHKALADFNSEVYATPQWYEIVTASDCAILDHTPKDFRPIVKMIDNFERNHKLGILFEANILNGKLLVCTSRLSEIIGYPEVNQFANSIINYAVSDDFEPKSNLEIKDLEKLF